MPGAMEGGAVAKCIAWFVLSAKWNGAIPLFLVALISQVSLIAFMMTANQHVQSRRLGRRDLQI